MIPKEIKASPVFGEFSPEEQDRYFDLSREKVCAHVDTLYYTVSISEDSNELLPGVDALLKELKYCRAQKVTSLSKNVEFFGLNFETTRFVHYEYCLRQDEEFDVFISSFLPNTLTPRIVVQLRSRFLVQVGTSQAVCRSFSFVEHLLDVFGLKVNEVKENRFDYAFHTNLIQNPYKFFNDAFLIKKLKTKLRTYHKVGDIGKKIEIDYLSFGHRKSNDIFVRIYNKSREVIEKNYKVFFIDKWLKDKLINSYDHYVYTRAYEMKSYVTGLLVGRIDWYLEHGHNDEIKKELSDVRQSCYIKSDNTDELRDKVDRYLPPVTLIMNVEFQTKRKFYSSIDNFIDVYQKAFFEDGVFKGFYQKGDLPLFRIFSILGLRSEICNYLTSTSLCFVEKKGTKDERFCYFWRRINECYIEEYQKSIVDLWREHEHHADIEKTKRRICGTVASMSVLQNNGYKESSFLEDVSDVLCTLNDNDFYGFAPDPETGKAPVFEPPTYQEIKVRKERQYRSLTKELKKVKESKNESNQNTN